MALKEMLAADSFWRSNERAWPAFQMNKQP
jgi:hypothetical protein